MELNFKHNRNHNITKLIEHAHLHEKIALHCTKLTLYTSRASKKYNNMSAEFEALMGKNSNLVSFQSHALCHKTDSKLRDGY